LNPSATEQQRQFAQSQLNGITRVKAYAGSGKTFALCELAVHQARLNRRGLYLAFNKSAELEAKGRFPISHVTSQTINALAFGIVGRRYTHKLRNIRTLEVIKFMGLPWDWSFARMVLDTLSAWCTSDSYDFPLSATCIQSQPTGTLARRAHAAQVAKQLWARMIDPSDEAPISHDGYLKLFQLNQPSLSDDYLMLDEGQDTNPVTWDIVKRQTCPVVIVGDEYQSIYQFRGATNSMGLVVPDQEFHLTQCFRFGPAVARIANALLWSFYSEPTPLEGLGPMTQVGQFDNALAHAVIARTNATVFTLAVSALADGKSMAFVGGVKAYGFSKIVDTWHLASSQRERIKDPFIRDFPSFSALAEYAESAGDFEVKRLVDVVKSYGSQVTAIVDAIHAATLPSLEGAELILSTAHRCKGMTLPAVKVADDFPELIDSSGQILPPELLDRQEVNLLYVVLTRASHHLQLNLTTLAFLNSIGMDASLFDKAVSRLCSAPAPQDATPSPGITGLASPAPGRGRRKRPAPATQGDLFS
jgi:F-box protein, helicase, 18